MRGLVLNALRGLPDGETVLDRKSVERLWKDHVQLDKCIASLDEDGLIEILPGEGCGCRCNVHGMRGACGRGAARRMTR